MPCGGWWWFICQVMTDSCDPVDCSPPGSSVLGFFSWEYWSGLSFPPPGDLPNQGVVPMSPVSLALLVNSLPIEPFGSYGNSMFTFFFWRTNIHFSTVAILFYIPPIARVPVLHLLFSVFFFNTQPSGCKAIKNHCTLSSFITKQCASQTSILYPWLLPSFSLSCPPHGCCMHETVTQETLLCVFLPNILLWKCSDTAKLKALLGEQQYFAVWFSNKEMLEKIQMPISKGKVKQCMPHTNHEGPCSNSTEGVISASTNRGWDPWCIVKWKERRH